MKRAALVALLVVVGCHKESAEGTPPVKDWGSAQPQAHKVEAEPQPPPQQPPPPATQPEKTGARTLEKAADGRFVLGPFAVSVPADWTQKPVTSSMRAADFELPAKAGAEAELVIYYFGTNGAGSVQDNLDRWVGQFAQGDPPKLEKVKFAGQEATVVAVSGHFSAPAMTGGPDAVDKADQSLLGAIVASPNGPYYFKLVGAKATVAANEAKFRAMLKSLALAK